MDANPTTLNAAVSQQQNHPEPARPHRRGGPVAAALLAGAAMSLASPAAGDVSQVVEEAEPAFGTVLIKNTQGDQVSLGSGFFIDTDGHFVTNHHVIEAAHQAKIRTTDGRKHAVTGVLAEDRESDLAIVKVEGVDPDRIEELELASGMPSVGERLIAMGSPMGLEFTVTTGEVNAVREMNGGDDPVDGPVIQTDINGGPGSSGGPILNTDGEVVAVFTFAITGGDNLNFGMHVSNIEQLELGNPLDMQRFGQQSREQVIERALALLDDGQIGPALEKLDQARMADPGHDELWFLMGAILHEHGEHEEALQLYAKYLKQEPAGEDVSRALSRIGLNAFMLDEIELAETAFDDALSVDPENVLALIGLGEIAYLQEDWELAKAKLVEAYQLDPHSEAVQSLHAAVLNDYAAHELMPHGELDKAAEILLLADQVHPDTPAVYFNLALIALEQNDMEGFEKYYTKLQGSDPERAEKLMRLASN